VGCRVLDWHGQKVSMLCYGLKGSHVDLFVAGAKVFPDAPPEDKPSSPAAVECRPRVGSQRHGLSDGRPRRRRGFEEAIGTGTTAAWKCACFRNVPFVKKIFLE